MIAVGDCLWIETNADSENRIVRHPHFVLTEPFPGTQSVIIVCIDTLNSPRQERTVVLEAGAAPSISHRSYVNYKRARIESCEDLERLIAKRHAAKAEPISRALLERVQKGILDSEFTPEEVRQRYLDHLASLLY